METKFCRTEWLLGKEGMARLQKSRVAVFGLGGVGSYVVEGLIRSGVGHLFLVDKDTIAVSNINRQLPATEETVGRYKADVVKEHALTINPEAEIEVRRAFYLPETAADFFTQSFDYLVDAVDNVTAKIDLAVQAQQRNIPAISSMGAGNKLQPALFKVADIMETRVCPLAKVMRRELRKRGVTKLKVVYSEEEAIKPKYDQELLAQQAATGERLSPGSIAFVPSVAGMIIAGEVVKDIAFGRTGIKEKD